MPALDGNAAMDELNANGALKLDINGNEVVLTKEDLLIETAQMEGYVSEQNNDLTVVLDTNLTPQLVEEGFVRELISKIQTMRKEAGFEVMDKIRIFASGNETIGQILDKFREQIQNEVLAQSIELNMVQGYQKEWNINGEKVVLGVEKLALVVVWGNNA